MKKNKIRTVNLSNSNRRTTHAGKQFGEALIEFTCGGDQKKLAPAIIELVHLKYLDDNALQTLYGLIQGLRHSPLFCGGEIKFRGVLRQIEKEYRTRLQNWIKEGNNIK